MLGIKFSRYLQNKLEQQIYLDRKSSGDRRYNEIGREEVVEKCVGQFLFVCKEEKIIPNEEFQIENVKEVNEFGEGEEQRDTINQED